MEVNYTHTHTHFSQAYTEEPPANITGPKLLCAENHNLDVYPSTREVMNKLQELDPEKSPGKDSMHPAVLRNQRGTVAQPVSFILGKV